MLLQNCGCQFYYWRNQSLRRKEPTFSKSVTNSHMQPGILVSLTNEADSIQVDAALVYAALRKSGLVSNGCSGREIFLVYIYTLCAKYIQQLR